MKFEPHLNCWTGLLIRYKSYCTSTSLSITQGGEDEEGPGEDGTVRGGGVGEHGHLGDELTVSCGLFQRDDFLK